MLGYVFSKDGTWVPICLFPSKLVALTWKHLILQAFNQRANKQYFRLRTITCRVFADILTLRNVICLPNHVFYGSLDAVHESIERIFDSITKET